MKIKFSYNIIVYSILTTLYFSVILINNYIHKLLIFHSQINKSQFITSISTN